eukprot:1377324-Amorphochlora_amoeboformis.AAC.1
MIKLYPTHQTSSLFDGVPNRPPWRWLIVAPKRSGTDLHVDPLSTSAWNTLIEGYKVGLIIFVVGESKEKREGEGEGGFEDRERVREGEGETENVRGGKGEGGRDYKMEGDGCVLWVLVV